MRQRKNTPQMGLWQGLPASSHSSLLDHYNHLVGKWERHFAQSRTFRRVINLLVGMLCSSGRTTVSSGLYFLGEHEGSAYRAYYKALEDSPWKQEDLFETVLLEGMEDYPADEPVCLGIDETYLPKEGRVIPQAKYYHDPLADHFDDRPIHWALRMLHVALISPIYADSRPFSMSVAFVNAPAIQPLTRTERERITPDQQAEYNRLKKAMSIPSRGIAWIQRARDTLDANGYGHRSIRVVGDGSFMNQKMLMNLPRETHLVGRIRFNARLQYPSTGSTGRRFYSEDTVSPEGILKDDSIDSMEVRIHLGGRLRSLRLKDVSGLFWKEGSRRRPVRLLVIYPTPYRAPILRRKSMLADLVDQESQAKQRRKRKKHYNDPVYLLTTDLVSEARALAQSAANRWGLEVLHRDLKTGVGVGQPQCWRGQAVERVHSALVAAYSMLTLAAHRTDKNLRSDRDPQLGSWRRGYSTPPSRRSVRDVLTQFRQEIARFQRRPGAKGHLPEGWVLTLPETYQLD